MIMLVDNHYTYEADKNELLGEWKRLDDIGNTAKFWKGKVRENNTIDREQGGMKGEGSTHLILTATSSKEIDNISNKEQEELDVEFEFEVEIRDFKMDADGDIIRTKEMLIFPSDGQFKPDDHFALTPGFDVIQRVD